jgi:uncharacterized protein (DUF1501 family)
MNNSRRHFLRNASALPLAAASNPLLMSLAGIGEAAAQSVGPSGDYKALVCIFLGGGNDHANTLVPYDDASWDAYRQFRGKLAYFKNELKIGSSTDFVGIDYAATTSPSSLKTVAQLALTPRTDRPVNPSMSGRQFALAPALSSLLPKFNQGKLAVLLNVGTLVEPITAAEFSDGRTGIRNGVRRPIAVPPQVGSHNDQTSYWQSGGIEGSTIGWGGRIGDTTMDANSRSPFTCVSLQGNSVFLTGSEVLQYPVTAKGPAVFGPLRNALFGSRLCADALGRIVTGMTSPGNLFAREHARVTSRAIESGDVLNDALMASPITPLDAAQFNAANAILLNSSPSNNLGPQLAMVARIMQASRRSLGVTRQVFLVGVGGFDMHSGLAGQHPLLMQYVSNAMAAFYDQTAAMGMADNVTTFTASEFGRQFVSNGDGADHGWGSTHFALGGAVKGGAFYGKAPNFVSTHPTVFRNGDHLFDTGFMVPTTAVDQLAATLAGWMGVSNAQLTDILPNLHNFATPNLGFL